MKPAIRREYAASPIDADDIFDANLSLTHPTLAKWIEQTKLMGWTKKNIKLYFQNEIMSTSQPIISMIYICIYVYTVYVLINHIHKYVYI